MDAGQAPNRYHEDGYACLTQVAPPETAAALLGLIQHDMADPAVMERHRRRSDILTKPAFEFYSYTHRALLGFHWGLTSRMCLETGKRLAPTYAYFRLYQKDDVCRVHADRPSCEHSLSLPLAYSDGRVWEFDIGERHYNYPFSNTMRIRDTFGDDPFARLALQPGDAVLYQGVYRRHGRTTPNPNRWSAHVFMHWVDVDGPFKDYAFDRRPTPMPSDFTLPT